MSSPSGPSPSWPLPSRHRSRHESASARIPKGPLARRLACASGPSRWSDPARRWGLGIRSSLSRPGNCWDNAVAESFFSTLKINLLDRHTWPTGAGARSAIFEYIEVVYNRQRWHTTLGNLSPADYESRHAPVCAG
ncbi:MAG: transposase [Candidatus Dormibacteraeota bacterium]|uniref:Transposase n=1 Tax=Candidatus Aeolococcus gillhamiae TaxID=3127015 RepID=A0A934JZU3_9BACT|nr:transposase [Candidatus Dormibacteraeota bacterium]